MSDDTFSESDTTENENEHTWISIEYLILIGIDCKCYFKKSMLEI